MKPRATIVIMTIALSVLAIVAWNWFSNESRSYKTVSTDRSGQTTNERAASSEIPQHNIALSQSQSGEPDENPPNGRRAAHVKKAIASIKPQGQELIRKWELKSFRPLGFTNTLLHTANSSAAAIVIPPPDEAAEAELRDLLIAEIADPSLELTSSEIAELKAATGWPSHSRVILAQTVSGAEDSVIVFEGADEKNVSLDPVTGDVSFKSDNGVSFSEPDLDSWNRYSHLFGVDSEQ